MLSRRQFLGLSIGAAVATALPAVILSSAPRPICWRIDKNYLGLNSYFIRQHGLVPVDGPLYDDPLTGTKRTLIVRRLPARGPASCTEVFGEKLILPALGAWIVGTWAVHYRMTHLSTRVHCMEHPDSRTWELVEGYAIGCGQARPLSSLA